MIRMIYYIILAYFLLGATGFFFINRKQEKSVARKNRIKLITYFVIINTLFFSIVMNPPFFRYIALLIIAAGFLELLKLYRESGHIKRGFFVKSLLVFGVISSGFIFFSRMEMELTLYVFLILSIFDSFSQISGQLWGRRKMMPRISPNKTWEGFAGGAGVAILSGLMIRTLIDASAVKSLLLTVGVVLSAFAGDAATSFYKRNYNVKDFSNFIPGHGGFLDRFDSLVAAGAWIAFTGLLIEI
jgi:phosphatidate cytidylyltransferase